MPDTPPNGNTPGDAQGAMGPAPGVAASDRERIRAEARAKLFGEPRPAAARGTDATVAGEPEVDAPEPVGEDPERIGRFRILGRLGAGGMGVVYSAYDPELDRKVALKLLRPDLVEDESRGSKGTSRLQREAQAMARLDHPNVVAVHEVGRHGSQVFVAMEFVQGLTLSAWVEGDRDWPEVVRVYCDAAAGLGAAHAAGIVHRDFKPDNVMLGDDGRVRVMDFGLSRADVDGVGPDGPVGDERTFDRTAALTATGAVMGTPAYMAPEQHGARPTTPASDQFSWCVSLWEALAGERPFAGRTYGELAGNVVLGRIRDPPGTATAPRRVFDVLRRGLAVKPEDRYESMEAVARGLQQSPGRTLRRVGIGAATLAVVGGFTWSWTRPEAVGAGACDDAGDPIRASWTQTERDAVHWALLASGAPYAEATWSTVSTMLDRYAAAWSRAAETHCTAGLVESVDATMLERQAQCLEARRTGFEELVKVVSSAEEGIVQQAVQAVVTLAPVDACSDPRRLEAFTTLRDPEVIAALSQAQAQLSRATAHGGMGHYTRALELAATVIETGRRYDDPGTEAAGLLVRGQYEERAGYAGQAERSLRDAIRLAEIAHDHTTRALALIRLIYVVGSDAKRHDEAMALGADAGAVLRMLGADPLLQAMLDTNLGAADRSADKVDAAARHYQAALDTYLELYGEPHPATGGVLLSMGSVLLSQGEPEGAIALLLRAKANFEATLGAEHPFVPLVLNNLGTAYTGLNDFEHAIETLEEGLALRKLVMGSDHPGVSKTLFNLGAAQYEARRYADAIASLREGAEILRDSGTASPDRIGRYELLIGSAQVSSGQLEEARATLEPLLMVFPLARGPDGRFARRTRHKLAIATMPIDLRRAHTLAEVARESADDDDLEVPLLEGVLWLTETAAYGPTATP